MYVYEGWRGNAKNARAGVVKPRGSWKLSVRSQIASISVKRARLVSFDSKKNVSCRDFSSNCVCVCVCLCLSVFLNFHLCVSESVWVLAFAFAKLLRIRVLLLFYDGCFALLSFQI